MAAPCAKPPVLYRPRDPQASDLWRLIDQHFDSFQQVYDERYQAKYGYWRPIIEQSVTAYLKTDRNLLFSTRPSEYQGKPIPETITSRLDPSRFACSQCVCHQVLLTRKIASHFFVSNFDPALPGKVVKGISCKFWSNENH